MSTDENLLHLLKTRIESLSASFEAQRLENTMCSNSRHQKAERCSERLRLTEKSVQELVLDMAETRTCDQQKKWNWRLQNAEKYFDTETQKTNKRIEDLQLKKEFLIKYNHEKPE